MQRKHKSDLVILFATLGLMALGLIVIYAIGPMRANVLNNTYGANYDPNYFFWGQLRSVGLSLLAFFAAFKWIPYKYIKKALDVFNKQFFAASSMTKVADGEYKFTCDLASLAVADDIPDDEVLEAEAQIEKLKAMDSIDLTLKLNGDKVAEFVGTFVKEGKTSTIKIEFLSLDAVTIDVPNASEYTEKTK